MVKELSQIFYSQYGAVRHLEFVKYAEIHFASGLQWQSACSCKISSRSVEQLRSYHKLKRYFLMPVLYTSLFHQLMVAYTKETNLTK